MGKGRTRRRQGLWIRYSFCRAENLQELIAFPLQTAERTQLLEDQCPRDDGKEEKKRKDSTGNPARLLKNVQ